MAEPILAPSAQNWTPATPTLSAAAADRVTEPETAAPAAGAVIDTVGGVVSGTGAGALEATAKLQTWWLPESAYSAQLLSVETVACSVRKAKLLANVISVAP